MSGNIKADVESIIRSVKPKEVTIFAMFPDGTTRAVFDAQNADLGDLMALHAWFEFADEIHAVRWMADDHRLSIDLTLRDVGKELKLV